MPMRQASGATSAQQLAGGYVAVRALLDKHELLSEIGPPTAKQSAKRRLKPVRIDAPINRIGGTRRRLSPFPPERDRRAPRVPPIFFTARGPASDAYRFGPNANWLTASCREPAVQIVVVRRIK